MHKYVATRPNPTLPPRRMGPRRYAYRTPVGTQYSPGSMLIRLSLWVAAFALLFVLFVFGYKWYVDTKTSALIYAPGDAAIPHNHVALVFGAGLNSNGEPSAMLYDRIATGVDLYKVGKVDKLVMTGDNGEVEYNEVEAMRKTAVTLGVPDRDILLDYAGFNTWDSCYRAREIFSLNSATLVTQRFHLPRALHSCNALHVNSVGVAADRQPYDTFRNELREIPALANTFYRMVTNDQPRFLGPKVDVDEVQER